MNVLKFTTNRGVYSLIGRDITDAPIVPTMIKEPFTLKSPRGEEWDVILPITILLDENRKGTVIRMHYWELHDLMIKNKVFTSPSDFIAISTAVGFELFVRRAQLLNYPVGSDPVAYKLGNIPL